MGKDEQLDVYRERMQEIVRRLDVVESLLRGNPGLLYLPPTVECIYLQFRYVLELIATASLVVNDDADDVLQRKRMRKWHAGDILEAVETVNPDYYYPQPRLLIEKDHPADLDGFRGEWENFEGDYLTREKFDTLYDICGKLLHISNPFDKKALVRNKYLYESKMQEAPKWRERIINLLTHHMFKLAGEEDMLYLCYTGPNAEFHISTFQRMELPDNPTPQEFAEERARLLDPTIE